MSIVVLKFGGTSVGNVERIQKVAERVKQTIQQGFQCVVVVSAMGKSTDELVRLANQIHPSPPPREMDVLLTTGEQVSMSLLSMALQRRGIPARSFTGWQAGIETDSTHGKAMVRQVNSQALVQSLQQGEVAVVAGFQGVSDKNEITTLGRGGSDTTAVTLAAALQAEYCEIYTDVTGVFSADPRIVERAGKLNEISFEEMLELARLGAGVLHPRAVECAMNHQVKLVVRSSFVDDPGTWVKEASSMEEQLQVRGVAHDFDVARMKILGLPNHQNTLSQLFQILAEAQINVDMIVQSEHDRERVDVAFSVSGEEQRLAEEALKAQRERLGYHTILAEGELAKVSIVGVGMMTRPGVAAKMFSTLSEAGIHVKMVSTSEIKISCVVDRSQAVMAVKCLHHAFGLDVSSAVDDMVTLSS